MNARSSELVYKVYVSTNKKQKSADLSQTYTVVYTRRCDLIQLTLARDCGVLSKRVVEWALLLSHLVPTVHNQCMNDTTGRGSKKKHGTRKD